MERTLPKNNEQFFVPAIGEPLARDLVDRMGIRSTDRVLDVACGTGIVARLAAWAAEVPGSIAGLDPNAAMLAGTRRASTVDAIEWHEAPAEQMPLPDDSFDVIACQMGFSSWRTSPAHWRKWNVYRPMEVACGWVIRGPAPDISVTLATAMERHIGPQAAERYSRNYVADMLGSRMQVYDSAGVYIQSIGREGDGPGEFRVPFDMIFAGEELWVRERLKVSRSCPGHRDPFPIPPERPGGFSPTRHRNEPGW